MTECKPMTVGDVVDKLKGFDPALEISIAVKLDDCRVVLSNIECIKKPKNNVIDEPEIFIWTSLHIDQIV